MMTCVIGAIVSYAVSLWARRRPGPAVFLTVQAAAIAFMLAATWLALDGAAR